MPGQYTHILVETTPEGVRTLTLNRPERLNAVNVALSEELPRAVADATADDAVRVVLITGAGRGFCAGLDLDPANIAVWQAQQAQSRAARLDELEWVGRWVLSVVECQKPVIAAINGPAAGAGLGLALAADVRLMSASATVTTGYTRRGLCPDAGVSYFLPRVVGLSRAMDLVLTARDVGAEEAERIGLISQVLAADSFQAAALDYATHLAAGAPVALALSKRLVATSLDTDLGAQLRKEFSSIRICFATDDLQEALRAFGEKRAARFTGR